MAKASEVMAGLGFLTDFLPALRKRVKELGGKEEDIGLVTEQEGMPLVIKFAELIVEAGNALRSIFSVVVDYGLSLAGMIAAGKYDYANSDISDNFPMQRSGQQNVVVELVHFGRDMESDAVLKELDARGLRAAILPELLAFGATYPEKQREFPIVALGSVWRHRRGGRYAPCLGRDGSVRRLDLGWLDYRWRDDCRFAAVRK